jgi:hypothetical protein
MTHDEAIRNVHAMCAEMIDATAGLGVQLDYSVESLHVLDELVEMFRTHQIGYDECDDVLFAYGLYLGEVIRRHVGGAWRRREDTPIATRAPMLVETRAGFANPIAAVMLRYERGDDDNLPLFFHETRTASA